MSSNLTWEKFQQATVALARSTSIKDRLTSAYRNHLAEIAEDELPKELREEFRALTRALTRERPLLRGEDALRATVRKMSCEEAEDIARSVVQIFGALPRNPPAVAVPAAPARSKNPRTAQVVPLYIAEA